ncbi:hypothetical protein SUDANB15_07143 [Streptomyces sp. enrichment culture]
MDVVPSPPAEARATRAAEPGDGPFDDSAEDAQAGAVRGRPRSAMTGRMPRFHHSRRYLP